MLNSISFLYTIENTRDTFCLERKCALTFLDYFLLIKVLLIISLYDVGYNFGFQVHGHPRIC